MKRERERGHGEKCGNEEGGDMRGGGEGSAPKREEGNLHREKKLD